MEENVTITPWICKGCNTHNLEQDDVCRKCGLSKIEINKI